MIQWRWLLDKKIYFMKKMWQTGIYCPPSKYLSRLKSVISFIKYITWWFCSQCFPHKNKKKNKKSVQSIDAINAYFGLSAQSTKSIYGSCFHTIFVVAMKFWVMVIVIGMCKRGAFSQCECDTMQLKTIMLTTLVM